MQLQGSMFPISTYFNIWGTMLPKLVHQDQVPLHQASKCLETVKDLLMHKQLQYWCRLGFIPVMVWNLEECTLAKGIRVDSIQIKATPTLGNKYSCQCM
jgi:hypothetical protein